ncbi:acanthoscurrin-1-like [Rhipicephalus sanguineus]|uniref:acanthoscurrin-1-like n=1 Tax=Rhipicephalus sanguineus TaxID=34632 RepID=UPI00189459C9|nr:acanthoscurrin-1-like [Rhipicephalus sanguineus]
MRTLVVAVVILGLVATTWAGNVALGGGLGGLGSGGVLLGAAPAVGLGGVGIGSSVALLHGGPAFTKAVAGPSFLVRTVHHVSKVHGGGAVVAHSGLGGGYGVGLGGLGYGGLGYGGLGYGGLGYGGYGGHGGYVLKFKG